MAYALKADTYHLRQKILSKVEPIFQQEVSTKEYNRYWKDEQKKHTSQKNHIIFIWIKIVSRRMPEEKKKYPIRHVVNWYYGNYCARKCFDNEERLSDHWKKLQLIIQKNESLQITHRDFLDLFNDHFKICTLEDSFKRKMVSWKLMTILQRTPEYDSDQIIVEKGILKTKSGPLPKPTPGCQTCRKLGIPD